RPTRACPRVRRPGRWCRAAPSRAGRPARGTAGRSPSGERFLELAEDAPVRRGQATLGPRLPPHLGQLLQQLALPVVELGGHGDVEVHDEVTAPGAAQAGDAEPGQGDRLVRLGTRRQVDLDRPVERLQGEGRAERGGGHRDLDGAVQVVTAATERLVRPDDHLDVEVAGRTATRADLTLAAQLDAGAGVDAGGNLDGQLAAGPDPAVPGAVEARVLDDLAVAAAGAAGARGHDLAEERPLHLLHLAAPAADAAGAHAGAGLGAGAVAGGAAHRGVDGQGLLAAEDGGGQVDVQLDQRVLAALR